MEEYRKEKFMKYKKIFLIITIIVLTSCSKNITDAFKFKKEYEKYNNTNIKLNISEKNIIQYKTKEEINKIIEKETGVIFIGSPQENKSRIALKLLLEAAENTDLQEIYYINTTKEIKKIKETNTPLTLFVLDGKILEEINNTKNKLTEDEEIELYNKYLENIHKVLQDTCSEEC